MKETVTLSPVCGYGVLIIAGLLLCVLWTVCLVVCDSDLGTLSVPAPLLGAPSPVPALAPAGDQEHPLWGFGFTCYMFSFISSCKLHIITFVFVFNCGRHKHYVHS